MYSNHTFVSKTDAFLMPYSMICFLIRYIQHSIHTVVFNCLMSVVMTSKCKVLFQSGCRGMLADSFCLAGNPCRAANKLAGMIKGDRKWFQPSKSVHSVSILLQLLFPPVC